MARLQYHRRSHNGKTHGYASMSIRTRCRNSCKVAHTRSNQEASIQYKTEPRGHGIVDYRTQLTSIIVLALDMPFLLLPFRPASDPSAARTFIRNYFNPTIDPETEKMRRLEGEHLSQELRLTEPMVSEQNLPQLKTELIVLGPLQCHEVVLEQTRWWSRILGRVRAIQSRRTWYSHRTLSDVEAALT